MMRGVVRVDEASLGEALRDLRMALLEADVNFGVVKDFLAVVRERAQGQEVLDSLTPGQQVVKVVHEEMVKLLGGARVSLRLEGGCALAVLAEVYASEGYRDHDNAEACYSEAVAALEAVGGSDIGRAHLAGARIARARGEGDLARARARQAQQILKAHKRGYFLRHAETLLDELA